MIKSMLAQCNKWPTVRMISSWSDSVKVAEIQRAGVLTLNRPKSLNTINVEMVRLMFTAMQKWQNTKSLVIIKSDLENVFCAGGDVHEILDSSMSDNALFLREEYELIHLIAKYRVPCVALLNGITMGSGVGLTVHGQYRVATEKTAFAMPEILIGIIPDVGCGYVLPRLPGQLGIYLGLTGDRLKGRDVFITGVATHFCEHSRISDLENALVQCANSSEVDATLSTLCPIDKSAQFSLKPQLQRINECFSGKTIEEILTRLEQDNSEWAQQTLKTLHAADPFSLKVTLHQLQTGRHLNRIDCFKMDMRIVFRRMIDDDFREGVRAMLVDRDKTPKWKHPTVKDVSDADILSVFRPFEDWDEKLQVIQ